MSIEGIKETDKDNDSYTVQWGDTLSSLAKKYGTSVEKLAQINGIKNPDLIFKGASLIVPSAKRKEPVNPFGGVPRSKQPPQISFDEAIRKVLPTAESIGRITKPISDFITEAQSTIKSIPDFISKASRETYRRKKEELGLRSFDTKPARAFDTKPARAFDTKPARAYDPRRSKKKEKDPEAFIKEIEDTYGRFWGNRARELMIRAGEIEGTEEQREYIENIEPNWSGEKAERDEPDKETRKEYLKRLEQEQADEREMWSNFSKLSDDERKEIYNEIKKERIDSYQGLLGETAGTIVGTATNYADQFMTGLVGGGFDNIAITPAERKILVDLVKEKVKGKKKPVNQKSLLMQDSSISEEENIEIDKAIAAQRAMVTAQALESRGSILGDTPTLRDEPEQLAKYLRRRSSDFTRKQLEYILGSNRRKPLSREKIEQVIKLYQS